MNPGLGLAAVLALLGAPALGWAADDTRSAAPAGAAGSAPSATPAPPQPSLMLTPDEVKSVEKAIADRNKPATEEATAAQATAAAAATAAAEQRAKPRIPNIYVSAVVDFGGGDWTVWANGLRVTPDRQPALFRVASVSGNTVEIVVPEEGNIHLKLQPYQTWRSAERDIVEGIVP